MRNYVPYIVGKHSCFQELEGSYRRRMIQRGYSGTEDLTGDQTEFWEELWGGLADHICIDEKSSAVVFQGD